MPHIHIQPGQHDHTVTAYIIRIDTQKPVGMLHMHKKLDILLPVGGHIELHETPWQAIAHELTEESGYDMSQLTILQPPHVLQKLTGVAMHPYPIVLNTHPITADHFHSDTAFAFVTSEQPRHNIQDGESSDIRWLTHTEIMALPSETIKTNTKEVFDFIFKHALVQWNQLAPTQYNH